MGLFENNLMAFVKLFADLKKKLKRKNYQAPFLVNWKIKLLREFIRFVSLEISLNINNFFKKK